MHRDVLGAENEETKMSSYPEKQALRRRLGKKELPEVDAAENANSVPRPLASSAPFARSVGWRSE